MKPEVDDHTAASAGENEPSLAVVDAVILANRTLPGALLVMLHGIQDQLGYVPEGAVTRLAYALNLSRAEVHGVLSFYHDFRTRPPGRHVVRLCRAEACQAMGCERLEDRLRERLGISFNETSADGCVTLEPVYCLGNCACSPSLLVDGEVMGRVTVSGLDALIDELRSSAGRTS